MTERHARQIRRGIIAAHKPETLVGMAGEPKLTQRAFMLTRERIFAKEARNFHEEGAEATECTTPNYCCKANSGEGLWEVPLIEATYDLIVLRERIAELENTAGEEA